MKSSFSFVFIATCLFLTLLSNAEGRSFRKTSISRKSKKSITRATVSRADIKLEEPETANIIGGQNAPNLIAKYVARVIVTMPNGTVGSCTGFVVDKDLVVTNAHCFYPNSKVIESNSKVTVYIGKKTWQGYTADDAYRVAYVDVYKPYDGMNSFGDVAILTIKHYFPHSQRLAGISNRPLRDRLEVFIAGWGSTTPDGPPPRTLQYADLKYMDYDECTKYVDGDDQFRRLHKGSMACITSPNFMEGGKGACSGDSGAPIFYMHPRTKRMWVVAMHTFRLSDKCAPKGMGSWAMKMKYFRSALKEVINHRNYTGSWKEVYSIY